MDREDATPPDASPPAGSERQIRSVPTRNAFEWYREAMILWRRAPFAFAVFALLTLASQLILELVPMLGIYLAQLVPPLVACALLYGMLAADRGESPRMLHLIAVLGARPGALLAVIASSVVTFALQALIAQWVAGFDLLRAGNPEPLAPGDALLVYGVGVVASLPLTFVPFAALFDGATFAAAFRQSFTAFARNVNALLHYGALSLVLLLFGLVTSGIGLLLALPWWAGSSYAAWKDIFALDAKPHAGM